MRDMIRRLSAALTIAGAILLGFSSVDALAKVDGVTGTTFNLTARPCYVYTADGGTLYSWGYALDAGVGQYPGPTMIVEEGSTVTVTLKNELTENVSVVFPGQTGVSISGGVVGDLTREAAPGGVSTVTYTFVASNPGTYIYHSGTRPDIQLDMGLVGALIVRPAMGAEYAYNHANTKFDYEYLFLLTEMDSALHFAAETGNIANYDTTKFWPSYWFINGRTAPDTMLPAGIPWFPYQPYNCMPMMVPGSKLLMRVANAGKDSHPFHHHGSHARLIATQGQMLESAPGAGPDLSFEEFTVQSLPGSTDDSIFEWTGKGLGWDIYGSGPDYPHDCVDVSPVDGFDDTTSEWCEDHEKPIPVDLPQTLDLTIGGHYSGSPYLGALGLLPPGEGGMNPNGGLVFMWHSHTEKEMTNYNIFPGGMMTMLIIEPPGTMVMK